jgi:type IX secretion system PorP/SprF family membrane protein
MKRLLFSIFILISSGEGIAQQYYPIFTQNYSNPFVINPSFLTLDRRAEINTTFRQQWVGITDGPKSIQLDFQYPLSSRISFGLNFYNDQSVLLNSSGALGTFGYRVPISSSQILGFGLSAGFVSNQIDLEGVPDVDLVDPVLLNGADNLNFDGQFGLHYQTGNFRLGISLLKLVDNRPFSEGSVENENFDPFKDMAAIVGYKFNVSDGVSLLPTLYYRTTYSGYEYFEGSLLVSYQNTFTVGGGYRMDLGPHVVLRIRLKGLQAGYSFDLPNTRYGGSTGGTHEIQLKLQLGNAREPIQMLAKKDSLSSVRKTRLNEKGTEQVAQIEESMPTETEVDKSTDVEPARPVSRATTPAEETSVQTHDNDIPDAPEIRKSDISEDEYPRNVTYQLVVGAYVRKVHADRYRRQLFTEGILAKVITGKKSSLYYVIVPGYATKAISLDRVLEIRNKTEFKDAWFQQFD